MELHVKSVALQALAALQNIWSLTADILPLLLKASPLRKLSRWLFIDLLPDTV